MTRLINKETMNLKATPPKRLLLMETMIRANGSYSCQIQAPPTWPSRTDSMIIKTVTHKKSSGIVAPTSYSGSRSTRATTHNPWPTGERERENAPPKRETRQRNCEIERNEPIDTAVHTVAWGRRDGVYIYIYIDFILSVYCIRQLHSIDHY